MSTNVKFDQIITASTTGQPLNSQVCCIRKQQVPGFKQHVFDVKVYHNLLRLSLVKTTLNKQMAAMTVGYVYGQFHSTDMPKVWYPPASNQTFDLPCRGIGPQIHPCHHLLPFLDDQVFCVHQAQLSLTSQCLPLYIMFYSSSFARLSVSCYVIYGRLH